MEIPEEEKVKLRAKIEDLRNNNFKQQRMPAYRPVPTFASTMTCFIVFGLIFIGLGSGMFYLSSNIVEISIDYTDCALPTGKPQVYGVSLPCNKEFNITTPITGKVFAYYELTNFYQNHRRYVRSRSYQQLMGVAQTVEDLATDCDPIVKNSDLAPYITKANDGKTALVQSAPANPCGLIAKSLFTDTFKVIEHAKAGSDGNWESETPLVMNDTNIAWKSDVTYKFKRLDDVNWNKIQWTDVSNQHFIVWMRTAGLPDFRKLYGAYDNGMKAGIHRVEIANSYDVLAYGGTKQFVLSTTNFMGGSNFALAYAYIVVGALSIVFSVIFAIAYKRSKK